MALADALPSHWDLRDPFGDLNLNLGLPFQEIQEHQLPVQHVPEFQWHQHPVQHTLNHVDLSLPAQHQQVQDPMFRSLPGSATHSARESAATNDTGRIAWGEGADLRRQRTNSSKTTPRNTPGKSAGKSGSEQRRAATPTLFGGRVKLFSAVHDTTPNCCVQMDSLVDRGKSHGPSSARPSSRRREPRPAPDFRQTEDWKKANQTRLQKGQQLEELQRRRLLERPGLKAKNQSRSVMAHEETLQSCRGSDAGSSSSWLDESSLWQGQQCDSNVSPDSRRQWQQAGEQTQSCSSQMRSRSHEVSMQLHRHDHIAHCDGHPSSRTAAQHDRAVSGYPTSGCLDEFAQLGSGVDVKDLAEAQPRRPPTPATARPNNITVPPQADLSLLLLQLSRLRPDDTMQPWHADLATPWIHESVVYPSGTQLEFPPWPHDTL